MEHAVAECRSARAVRSEYGMREPVREPLRRAPLAKSCAIVDALLKNCAHHSDAAQLCSKHIVGIDIDRPAHAGETALAVRRDEIVERALKTRAIGAQQHDLAAKAPRAFCEWRATGRVRRARPVATTVREDLQTRVARCMSTPSALSSAIARNGGSPAAARCSSSATANPS